jgi:hypothetical protein
MRLVGSTQANTSSIYIYRIRAVRGIQGAAKQAAPEEGAARHSMYQPVGAENWNE